MTEDLLIRRYMDNAATSFPKPASVTRAMIEYSARLGASAGRGAYREAVATGELIFDCRRQLCQLFHGEKPEHFIFTLNCTDALNLALYGILRPLGSAHVICTEMDHNSILRPLQAMADEGWLDVTRVPADGSSGMVDPDSIRRAIQRHTRLIAITHASNVTGTIQPISEIGAIAREKGIPFLVDAAQSAGHLPIDLEADNIDLLAAPGHKGLLGPLGTGFLYLRPGIEKILATVRQGGTGSRSESAHHPALLPDKYEAGSHNAIGIAGLSAALNWIRERGIVAIRDHEKQLSELFLCSISGVDGVALYGPRHSKDRVGVFSVRHGDVTPGELSERLEKEFGILTRAGLHCSPFAHRAIGTFDRGTTRLSLGPFLSLDDIRFAVDALGQLSAARCQAR